MKPSTSPAPVSTSSTSSNILTLFSFLLAVTDHNGPKSVVHWQPYRTFPILSFEVKARYMNLGDINYPATPSFFLQVPKPLQEIEKSKRGVNGGIGAARCVFRGGFYTVVCRCAGVCSIVLFVLITLPKRISGFYSQSTSPRIPIYRFIRIACSHRGFQGSH